MMPIAGRDDPGAAIQLRRFNGAGIAHTKPGGVQCSSKICAIDDALNLATKNS
jgi:hypothetical protein